MPKPGLGAGIMLGVYNAMYRTAYAGIYPAVRAGLVGSGWRWDERTGNYPPLREASGGRVWVHAASVGEVKAAAVLIDGLRERYADLRIVLSAITPAGWDVAREAVPTAEAVVQAPVDLRGAVKRGLSWFDPQLLIVVETELWPNMALECRRRGTKLAVASAKISARSYSRYRYIRPLMKYVLSSMHSVAAQSELDKERLCGLGLDESRVRVTGDIKLDSRGGGPSEKPRWLTALMREGDLLFVAGSTRPGEEGILGRALLTLKDELRRRLITVIAPRHMDRCGEAADKLAAMGLNVVRRSALPGGIPSGEAGTRVLVLDTLGELAGAYSAADFAFVGGTLAPFGGHNLAEPAAAGVPVLFGPSLETVRPVADALLEGDGGSVVVDAGELASALTDMSADAAGRRRRGIAAREAIESLRGAVRRTLDFFEESGALPPAR